MIRRSETGELSGGQGMARSWIRALPPDPVDGKFLPPVIFYQAGQRIPAEMAGFDLQPVTAVPARAGGFHSSAGRIHDNAYLTALKRYAVSLGEGEEVLCRKFDGGGYIPSRVGRGAWMQASASALCAVAAAERAVAMAKTAGAALTLALCRQAGRHAFPGRWAADCLLSNPVLAASAMAAATGGRVHLFDAGVTWAEGLNACALRDERISLSTLFSARAITAAPPPAPAEWARLLYVPAPCSLTRLGRYLETVGYPEIVGCSEAGREKSPLLLSLSARFIRMADRCSGGEAARLRAWFALGRILARRAGSVCLLVDGCTEISPLSRRLQVLIAGYTRFFRRAGHRHERAEHHAEHIADTPHNPVS